MAFESRQRLEQLMRENARQRARDIERFRRGARGRAQDARFTRAAQLQRARAAASAGGAGRLLSIKSLLAKFGGILLAADILAKIAEELSQQRLDEALRGQDNIVKEKLARRAKEKELRTILVRDELGGLPTEQLPRRATEVQDVRLPTRVTETAAIPSGVGVEIPDSRPDISSDVGSIRAPESPTAESGQQVSEGTLAEIDPFGNPATTGVQTTSAPVTQVSQGTWPFGDPFTNPFETPPFNPADLVPELRRRLTGSDADAVALPDEFVSAFQDPNAQPNPETNPRRRCKPCPKKKEPKPRDKCWKGLYSEGRMDDDIQFTRWAPVDCETGRQLSDAHRAGNVLDFPEPS